MAQGDYIELHQKRQGKRLDHEERTRKKEARKGHARAEYAKKVSASLPRFLPPRRMPRPMCRRPRVNPCGMRGGWQRPWRC